MHVLLTGATGLVGQYLLRNLLREGHDVAVLIRPQGARSAGQRLKDVLGHWERAAGVRLPRPVCLEGDISAAGLGPAREARAWVTAHCPGVLHNAASLTFVGTDRTQEPWRSNYTGTQNVLHFCQETGLRHLHYVSTAYVCGKRTGTILEDELDCGQSFRNDYEQCKFEAEKLVRRASFLDSLTVYRPAVITGDSRTGYTSTYHGFYQYLQFIWLMVQLLPREPDGRIHFPARLTQTGEERRNLVPVDWVSAVITHIFCHPSLHGQTYHLGPTKPVLERDALEVLADYFQFYGPRYVGPVELPPGGMNDYEKMYYSYMSRYEDYWSKEPLFDCRHTLAAAPHLPCPLIDKDCLRRLTDFAIKDRFGKRRERRKQKSARSGA
jgi:thioester reductase-like protein